MAVRERVEKVSKAVRKNRAVIAAGLGATGVLSLMAAGDASVTGCGEFSWEGNPTFNVPASADGVANEDLIPGQVILYDGGARDDGKHSFGFNTNLITPTSKTVFVNLVSSDDLWKEGGSPTNARVDFRGPSRGMVRLQSTLRSLDGKGKFDEANRLAIDISRLKEVMKYHPEATVLILREYVPHGNGVITDRTYNINQATIDQLEARKAVICAATTPTSSPTRAPDTSTPIPPSPTPSRTPVPPTATPTRQAETSTNTPVPASSTPTRSPEATPSSTPVPPTLTPTRTPEAPTASPTAERVRTLIPLPADGKARAINRVIGEPVKLENPNFAAGDPEANFRIGVEYGRFVIISSGGIKIADEDKQVGTDTIILTVVDGGRSQTEVDTYDFKVPNTYGIALTATKSLPNERLVNPGVQNQAALEEMLGQLITLLKEELGRGRTKAIINYYDGANGVFDQLKINDISAFIASTEDTSTPIPPSPTPSRTPVPATPTSTPTREPVIVTTPTPISSPTRTPEAIPSPQMMERLRLPIVINGLSTFEVPRPPAPTPTPDAYNTLQLIPQVSGVCEDNRENASWPLDSDKRSKGDLTTYFLDVAENEVIMLSLGYIRIAGREFTLPAGATDTKYYVFLDGRKGGPTRYEWEAFDEYGRVTSLSKSEPEPILQSIKSLRAWYNSMATYARYDLERNGIKQLRTIVYQGGTDGTLARRPIGTESFLSGVRPCS